MAFVCHACKSLKRVIVSCVCVEHVTCQGCSANGQSRPSSRSCFCNFCLAVLLFQEHTWIPFVSVSRCHLLSRFSAPALNPSSVDTLLRPLAHTCPNLPFLPSAAIIDALGARTIIHNVFTFGLMTLVLLFLSPLLKVRRRSGWSDMVCVLAGLGWAGLAVLLLKYREVGLYRSWCCW